MRKDNFSISEKKKIALKLKSELEREGFKTMLTREGTEVRVEDLPIPRIVPFDIVKLITRVDEHHIYFAIVFNFIKVLENLIDADEINHVYGDLHNEWFDKLVLYMSPINPDEKLKWDIEYDIDIEDTFYGNFDTLEEVIPFIHNLGKFIHSKDKEV
ncbi:MAG TPA: hypothetical protein VNN20_14675 [Thermodesulfobacteriota bacterium]|nr:hypothetical protein [Thermodesulfobacteriota bacterium]